MIGGISLLLSLLDNSAATCRNANHSAPDFEKHHTGVNQSQPLKGEWGAVR